ncbi:MAG: GreA/GreB family elongation factor [Gammaproteobacteria bacterium]
MKENDGEAAVLAPQRSHAGSETNYVTPRGAQALRDRLAELEKAREALVAEPDRVGRKSELLSVEQEQRYYHERLEQCVVVQPPQPPYERAGIGATVTVAGADDRQQRFTIVGEDESDAAAGLISWASPLGRALVNRSVGESVTWHRPIGDLELEVLDIDYLP